jgi:hypothetical protein
MEIQMPAYTLAFAIRVQRPKERAIEISSVAGRVAICVNALYSFRMDHQHVPLATFACHP